MPTVDCVVRHARIADGIPLRDLAIDQGRIVAVGEALPHQGRQELRLEGRVVLPGFVDLHMHLDKALTARDSPNPEGTLRGAIAASDRLKPAATKADLIARATRVVEMAIRAGTCALRTHTDVDDVVGLRGIEALLEVREAYRGRVRIQVVAFPTGRFSRDVAEGRALIRQALRAGADVLGGVTFATHDPPRQIDHLFALAREFDRDLDLHVDETDDPRMLSLEYLADKTVREGYQGRVCAGHCCSLAVVDDQTARRVIEKVREAGITVITNPATNLYLQGRRGHPQWRGLTRVRELLQAGVNLAVASDNVRDPFNPFGRADLLESALLLALAAQLGSPEEQAAALAMATTNPARAMGLQGYGLVEGAVANLVVLEAHAVGDVLAEQPMRAAVMLSGERLDIQAPSGAPPLG
ncbi:MAG: amidohydrolase family protein [Deltaproteobacteria bacterium]|nr:amidohydrolase family protein [Deltaproteobacteria bacterium]